MHEPDRRTNVRVEFGDQLEEGIDLEVKNFGDYNQPNPALSQGQLQLNEFQHLQYLANYNVKNNDNLVPIGATAVYPLPLYSTKHTSVDQILISDDGRIICGGLAGLTLEDVLAERFNALVVQYGQDGKPKTSNMARALAFRVGFSILLFVCILVAWKLGYIQPTGIPLR